MGWMDTWWGAEKASAKVPEPDRPRTLLLYQFASCPYCQRVQRELGRLGLQVEQRDTLRDPAAREALREATGGTQVPCLMIDGVPLLESADIVEWLRKYAGAVGGRT